MNRLEKVILLIDIVVLLWAVLYIFTVMPGDVCGGCGGCNIVG